MGVSLFGISNDQFSAQDFYIPPEITKEICESMEGDIGRRFVQFIST
jgi:hypothetical protein